MKLNITDLLENKKVRIAMSVLTVVTAVLLAVNAYYSIKVQRKLLKNDESQS